MKKFLTLVCGLIISVVAVFGTGCNNSKFNGLTFYAPDGAPALAIAKFINDSENFGIEKEFQYNVVSAGDIGTVMAKGEGDFIVMPVNLASKLYNSKADSPYVMTSVITHGNLYLMSSEGVSTLEGFIGKVIGVIGQGAVPDLTLKAIFSDYGLLDKVQVNDTATEGKISLLYFDKAKDMIPLLKQGKLTAGLLPEPACTNLTIVANNREWTRIDVQELYDEQVKSYPQAVLMVKKSVYEQYKDNIDGMGELFSANVQWVKDNTTLAVNAVNSRLKEGLTASLDASKITATVVDNCKIYYEQASFAKLSVNAYINKIRAINVQSANVVGEDFFA